MELFTKLFGNLLIFVSPLKKPHAAPRLYEVMLADQANRARLCALCAFFLDETDFRADPQSAVGPIEHRIAVKIDFAAVGRFDEAALIRRRSFATRPWLSAVCSLT